MSLFKRSQSVIGLDVGASAVKAVELQPKGEGVEVSGFGRIEVDSDDPASIRSAVERLIAEGGFGARRMASSINGKMVIVRHLQLQKTSPDEIKDVVRYEAEKYVPFPLDEAVLDWQTVGTTPQGDLEVLLVAAKREQVMQHLEAISGAGMKPEVVDLDAFAIANAHALAEGGGETKGCRAFIDVGARKTTINIAVDGASRFTREVSIGGRGFTETLARVLNMSFDEAEDYKREPGEGAAILEEALSASVEELANEIQLSFEWFQSQFHQNVERVLVSGGGSRLPFFRRILGDVLAVPVEDFDPFRSLIVQEGLDTEVLSENSSELAVAVGLAARLIRS